MQVSAQAQLGQLSVRTTSNRGHTPEELAEAAVERILQVGENVHPVIRDQAIAFKEQIKHILVHYMKQAVISDRTTLASVLKATGHGDLVKLLEK
jgi:hypothetical protein